MLATVKSCAVLQTHSAGDRESPKDIWTPSLQEAIRALRLHDISWRAREDLGITDETNAGGFQPLTLDFNCWKMFHQDTCSAILVFPPARPINLPLGFLDGQPPLTSPIVPCTELAGCGCCLTVGHWFFWIQVQPDVGCCQIHPWHLPASQQIGEMQNDFQRAQAHSELPLKGFPNWDGFRLDLSSELALILKSKISFPCVGRKPEATERGSHVKEEGARGELYKGKDATHGLSKWQSAMHHQH